MRDNRGLHMRGYAAIGLFNPKMNENVGAVLRSVHCFGAALVVIQGNRYTRARTDTTRAFRHVPLVHGQLKDLVPFDCVPVAVDLVDGATSLHSYTHPERAFYIFGPEDGTLGRGVTEWCRDVIYIPSIHCLNLAAAVNVVLYDRQKKRAREERVLNRLRSAHAGDLVKPSSTWFAREHVYSKPKEAAS